MRRCMTFCSAMLLLPVLAASALAGDYAGADVCKTCHPAEFEVQSRSAHAGALAPSHAGQPGEWAFGAGVQAITFVSRVDRENYLEHGETWYRALNGYGVTPGHRNSLGMSFRIFDPVARILRCFACHSTGPLTLSESDDRIIPHELGVRCEVCHGPAALHARDPVHNHPRNPGAMTAADLNRFCGTCHGTAQQAGQQPTDLRDPRNSRNQPLRLSTSACFRRTKGGMACLACHSPHEPLETRVAAYDSICRNCHAAPRHSTAIAAQACVECHMPAVPFQNLAFRNHRIAVYAAGDPVQPVSAKARK
jgi:cytochrome c554/c'-like protein